jgi:NADH:ubiquinone oxidoreductase subunit 5 (subunit L)/multisubunit Na+/H+ antiporter MnhA subunit
LLPGPIYSALKNKYWFDELYDWAFVRPTFWLARAVSRFDRSFIDTLLHLIGYLSLNIGIAVKNYFDVPVVNRTLSDGSGEVVKGFGQQVRILQTGRVQQYLLMTMAVILAVGVYLLLAR